MDAELHGIYVAPVYTVSPVILIRHTEFHLQPTSTGPGTRAYATHGKLAQHILV
jgi:hypothetical protein